MSEKEEKQGRYGRVPACLLPTLLSDIQSMGKVIGRDAFACYTPHSRFHLCLIPRVGLVIRLPATFHPTIYHCSTNRTQAYLYSLYVKNCFAL